VFTANKLWGFFREGGFGCAVCINAGGELAVLHQTLCSSFERALRRRPFCLAAADFLINGARVG